MTKPKHVQLMNLSRKHGEAQIQRSIRINKTMPSAGDLPFANDKVSAKYIRGGAVLLPKLPGMALPPSNNLFTRGTYSPGDGEFGGFNRSGADDHLKFKSRGF